MMAAVMLIVGAAIIVDATSRSRKIRKYNKMVREHNAKVMRRRGR